MQFFFTLFAIRTRALFSESPDKRFRQRSQQEQQENRLWTKMKPLKCVVVGDSGVGKTCLLTVYAQNHFPETYVPTIRDNFVMKVLSGDTVYELELFDTAGQEEYEKLRPLSYPGTVSIYTVSQDPFIWRIFHFVRIWTPSNCTI